ncbi:MAG: branched-chain amino acid ABC transporter permease [Kiritimatiellales bacterium]|nr:branched-chain amino acid ABC transporter permease [Kiritimatiellales bacterium]MCF7864055.1 branched-chain amino acid ABC transporter permease [Kiritimatiellales bacterium]
MSYILHIATIVMLYAMLAACLNLCSGRTRLLALSTAAFYGIGAYVAAIASTRIGASFLISLPLAVATSAAIALLVGLVVMRCSGEFFLLCTLSINAVLWVVANSWMSVTRGALGISKIPGFFDLSNVVAIRVTSLIVVGVGLIVLQLVCTRALSSPFGRLLWGLEDAPIFLAAMGKDAKRLRLTVFVLSAALSAIPGVFFAHHIGFVDPSSFTVMESVLCLAIVILGGLGNLRGGLIAAVAVVVLPEALRFLVLPDASAAQVRQIIYGLALVACMLWRPQGLIGEYAFGREAKPK